MDNIPTSQAGVLNQARDISQGDVAKRLGTHQPAIARMESGYVGEISFDFLIRVALALSVSIELTPLKKAA